MDGERLDPVRDVVMRDHHCRRCGREWKERVTLVPTSNISGEPTPWCPSCGSKGVSSAPARLATAEEEREVALRSILRFLQQPMRTMNAADRNDTLALAKARGFTAADLVECAVRAARDNS